MDTPDRRPIAARDRPIFQTMAAWLIARRARPNAISIAGMFCGTAAGVALAATTFAPPLGARALFLGAAALIQLRLLANMLDGMVAMGRGVASPLGELYNEVPDRISDFFTLAGLGYSAGGSPVLGLIAGALAILTAYIRAVGKAAGAGNDFRGPMAKQQRMFVVTLISVYLAFAPISAQPHWNNFGLGAGALVIIVLGCVVTCIHRLLGIASNLRGQHP
jgi:phosphatidylglycerophosphate synthase